MYGHPRAVDIDQDGDQDFVIGNGVTPADVTNPLRVYLKNGNTYTHAELPAPLQGNSPFPVDWHRDGDVDFVVGNGIGPMRLFLFHNDTYVESAYPAGYTLQTIGPLGAKYPFLTDWDGDGDWDLVLGSTDGRIRLYLNTTLYQGHFVEDSYANNNLETIDVGSESYPTVVDWDGDGNLDLIVGNQAGQVRYYENDGSNNFVQDTSFGPVNVPPSMLNPPSAAPTVLNFDTDGDLDLFVGTDTGQFFSYYNNGSNSFLNVTPGGFLDTNGTGKQFVNLDNDADLDIVSGGGPQLEYYAKHNTLNIYQLQSIGNLGSISIPIGGFMNPYFIDWDFDGDQDFLLGASYIYLFVNDGSNNFLQSFSTTIASCGNICTPVAVDWDFDGDYDILTGNFYGQIQLLINNGSNSFTLDAYTTNNLNTIDVGTYSSPMLIDWDHHGGIDLVIGGGNGKLNLFLNSGNTFTQIAHEDLDDVYVGRKAYPVFADTDGNGLEELYVGNSLGWIYKYNVLRDDDSDAYWTDVDCDDDAATIHPGATEICGDGVDQDCSGVDLGCDSVDNDGDGYAEIGGDCDDTDTTIFVGATDICDDGIDQNCDGADVECAAMDDPIPPDDGSDTVPGDGGDIVPDDGAEMPLPTGATDPDIVDEESGPKAEGSEAASSEAGGGCGCQFGAVQKQQYNPLGGFVVILLLSLLWFRRYKALEKP